MIQPIHRESFHDFTHVQQNLEPKCLLSRPSGTLSSVQNGGEGRGEVVIADFYKDAAPMGLLLRVNRSAFLPNLCPSVSNRG